MVGMRASDIFLPAISDTTRVYDGSIVPGRAQVAPGDGEVRLNRRAERGKGTL